MGLQPKIEKPSTFLFKKCAKCGQNYGPEMFSPSKSLFCSDGVLPICDSCLQEIIAGGDGNWDIVDKLCQYADIPFIPNEWERMLELNQSNTFHKYAEVFVSQEYAGIDWSHYFNKFRTLEDNDKLEDTLPRLNESKRREYRERWGAYSDEAYQYLENLYNGLMATQSVNGSLQIDQAIKICKISYEIDKKIEEGSDFDKLLSSYDKLVKAAEFTPKNVKNINDFDTVGELVRWMEKKGWKNNYYDDVKRDVVDETIANIQNFNRRLYVNESGIGDEINHRIEMLKAATSLENDNYYGTDVSTDLDRYDNEGFEQLFADGDEFEITMEEENNE